MYAAAYTGFFSRWLSLGWVTRRGMKRRRDLLFGKMWILGGSFQTSFWKNFEGKKIREKFERIRVKISHSLVCLCVCTFVRGSQFHLIFKAFFVIHLITKRKSVFFGDYLTTTIAHRVRSKFDDKQMKLSGEENGQYFGEHRCIFCGCWYGSAVFDALLSSREEC